MQENKQTIFVAGASGMVGSAIIRALMKKGRFNVIGSYHTRRPESSLINDQSSLEVYKVDLTRQKEVESFFAEHRPDQVCLAAAKVGGIHANNTYPAEFIRDNLAMECNVIHAAHAAGVQKLLFLGSSCIYPKLAEQPMKEEALLTGRLEPTNEPYAIAKIAGIKLCESYNRQYGRDYRSVMPTNLYGPGDNFHPENSHVIPALMRRFHEAKAGGDKKVVVWGSGNPRREFLHVDDLAEACVFVMNMEKDDYDAVTEPMLSHINVGTGTDISIAELADLMAQVVGYDGEIVYDASMPDGTPRKLLDVSKITGMGWKPGISLRDGLKRTYEWFLEYAAGKTQPSD